MAERAGTPPLDIFPRAVDIWTEGFWEAASKEKLVACRCADCKTFRHPPGPYCPNCLSQNIEWPELSGKGEIFTFTVIRRTAVPGLAEIVPYVVGSIAIPEADNIRFVGAVIDCDPADVKIGKPVEVAWVHGSEGKAFPHWRLAK